MKKFKLITVGLAASIMSLSGCGHQHTFASTWSFDADKHWLEATCEHAGQIRGNEGNHIDADGNRLCDVCGASLGEQPHVHSYSSSWSSDGENHWHECSCGAKTDVAAHVDSNNDGICDVCEATLPQVVSVSIIDAPSTLMETQSATLKANVSVKGGADKSVTWSVDKAELATISSSGVLKALKAGVVKVTATSKFDSTKSASVNVEITEQYWTEDDLATFALALPEPIPFIKGNWTVDGEYAESYGVIIVYTEDNGAVAAAKAAFEADPNYNYLGTSYDPDYDCDDYYYAKPSTDYLGYQIFCDIYEIDGETTIECYFECIEYDEWPTELIASFLEECGFDITIPAYTARDPGTVTFTAQAGELEEGGNAVLVTASGDEGAKDTAEDYVHLFSTESYKVDAYDDGYGGSFYLISDKAKTVTIQVANVYDIDWEIFDIVQYPGFEVMVMDYIPDYSLELLPAVDMIEVGSTLTMDVVKGEDIKAEDVITFTSSDAAVATVSADGVVTGVKAGEVQITAAFGDVSSAVSTIYVVDAIPTAFTQAQLDEFDKIHPGKDCAIPFNKYFTSVKYDETEKYVSVTGLEIDGEIMESIYAGMIAGGWEDVDAETYADYAEAYGITVDEARIELYEYYGYYSFTKLIEDKYLVGADLYIVAYDEYYEEDVIAFEGNVHVDVYDDYIYSYDDAKSAIGTIISDLGIETTASFPDSLPGNRFAVEYDGDYNMIFFDAYNVGDLTLAQVVSALSECGWDAEVKHEDSYVDEDTGETVPAVDYISAVSKDEVLELEAMINDGDISFYVFLPNNGPKQLMDIDDLQDGDQIYIASLDSDLGMGAYNGKKNFASVSIYDEETDSYFFDDCTLFTVTDNGDGTWGLEDEDGNAYGADGSKNIKIDGAKSYDWTITIDDEGNATLECAGWVLMLNETTSPAVYKTYASSFEGTAVQIFVA